VRPFFSPCASVVPSPAKRVVRTNRQHGEKARLKVFANFIDALLLFVASVQITPARKSGHLSPQGGRFKSCKAAASKLRRDELCPAGCI
jgi:hypothetical protein